MAGIYIHIPFCKRRCIYCDFYSTTLDAYKEAYVDAVCTELSQRRAEVTDPHVRTLYIGGGTPSQLAPAQLSRIIETCRALYPVTSDAEITVEANPDDLTDDYLAQLRAATVNRLSMGIQTFNERQLTFLRRRHTAQEAIDAVQRAQRAGFSNISIDLIYGLPNETLEQWQSDIAQAVALGVQHISAYNLIYEEGTPLYRMRQQGEVSEADEDLSLCFFDCLIDRLAQAGFVHYEISNFALPGYHSRHNSSYWTDIPYLGIGAAAHSYDGHVRQKNVPDLHRYLHGITSCAPVFEREVLTPSDRYNDLVLTSLRTVWGLDLRRLSSLSEAAKQNFTDYCLKNAQSYLDQQKLTLLPASADHPLGTLRLTRKGLFVSDEIMSDLMWVD
jgi:putative oxygen-independent coproporphyrinogen III oxidase